MALFYAGMVRKKNVLATMAQCLAATFLVSILWVVVGYSLTFTGGGDYIGGLSRVFLHGMASQQRVAAARRRSRKICSCSTR